MNKFRRAVTNSFQFKLFKLKDLPLAYVAGLRVNELNDSQCTVSIKHNYLTKNPFRSMYFAAQAMAAELSTGAMVMDKVQDALPTKISMLVFTMRADFSKKATGRIHFTCTDGKQLDDLIKTVIESNEGQTIEMKSVGVDESGEVVSTFYFTWTLKKKHSKV